MKENFCRSFRINASTKLIVTVEKLLEAEGFRFSPEPFIPTAYRLHHEPFALGNSLASYFGYIYIQDRSSMLPPYALNPKEGAVVLDMCSSPGSKSSQLANLVGKNGLVIANESNGERMQNLRRNLANLNLANVVTVLGKGEVMAIPQQSFDYIQLDPPCSAWGTVNKNPKVMQMWQGQSLEPLISLQQKLLVEATRLLKNGGKLVYSTCTTNVQENEDMCHFAIQELGLELQALPNLDSYNFEDSLDGVWKLSPSEDAQGFFVASFCKKSNDSNVPKAQDTQELHESEELIAARDYKIISSEELANEAYDFAKLPSGELAIFNDWLHFLPTQAMRILAQNPSWQGMPVGKVHKANIKILPKLRTIMPDYSLQEYNLDLDLVQIKALLQGQSLAFSSKTIKDVNLYWQELPLTRLSQKNNRLVLAK